MIYTHNINPILVSIGPIDLYWYGAMYAISFLLIDYMMKREVNINQDFNFNIKIIDHLIMVSIISVIIGGRLGYVLFYNLEYYSLNPLKVFFIWEGGMSFHGALLGIYLGLVFVSMSYKIKLFNN